MGWYDADPQQARIAAGWMRSTAATFDDMRLDLDRVGLDTNSADLVTPSSILQGECAEELRLLAGVLDAAANRVDHAQRSAPGVGPFTNVADSVGKLRESLDDGVGATGHPPAPARPDAGLPAPPDPFETETPSPVDTSPPDTGGEADAEVDIPTVVFAPDCTLGEEPIHVLAVPLGDAVADFLEPIVGDPVPHPAMAAASADPEELISALQHGIDPTNLLTWSHETSAADVLAADFLADAAQRGVDIHDPNRHIVFELIEQDGRLTIVMTVHHGAGSAPATQPPIGVVEMTDRTSLVASPSADRAAAAAWEPTPEPRPSVIDRDIVRPVRLSSTLDAPASQPGLDPERRPHDPPSPIAAEDWPHPLITAPVLVEHHVGPGFVPTAGPHVPGVLTGHIIDPNSSAPAPVTVVAITYDMPSSFEAIAP